MSVHENQVMLSGFLMNDMRPADAGNEIDLLVHDFIEYFDEKAVHDGYGIPVLVRLGRLVDEQADVLRRGVRVRVIGRLVPSDSAPRGFYRDPRPVVAAIHIARTETLKACSRSSHPLNPRWWSPVRKTAG
jgi:hypothetical protein